VTFTICGLPGSLPALSMGNVRRSGLMACRPACYVNYHQSACPKMAGLTLEWRYGL